MIQEQQLKYTPEHEWVAYDEATKTATIGITQHAQESLGDIVFVELPKVGHIAKRHDSIGSVESVKTTSDIYAPLSGEISAINEQLASAPESINQAPYDAWLFKIKASDAAELNDLLSYDAYQATL